VIVTHEATILDLRSCLDSVETAFPLLCEELSHVRLVCDDAWNYDYLEGLERMRDHVLLIPRSNLRSLKVQELPPDPAALKRGASIGKIADPERTLRQPRHSRPL